MSDAIWQIPKDKTDKLEIIRFTRWLNDKFFLNLDTYDDLYAWSLNQAPQFWAATAEFCKLHWMEIPKSNAEVNLSVPMRQQKWFPGGKLNYAQNLLSLASDREDLIIAKLEGTQERTIGKRRLILDVKRLQDLMREWGLKPHDVVAGAVCNSYEALVAALACASLGAQWTSCSPDFGEQAILDRFGQVSPKLFFYSLSYNYGGKTFDCQEKMQAIAGRIPSIQQVIPIDHGFSSKKETQTGGNQFKSWSSLLPDPSAESLVKIKIQDLHFEALAFDHPLFIMYSSGTTGIPKCIVHGHGGTLLQHMKEHRLHCNLNEQSRLFYFTTCGWMMWNWMISALASGSSLFIYDGGVHYPSLELLWDFLENYKVTAFGTSPRFLTSCMNAALVPKAKHAFGKLQTFLSTGSPLLPEHYDYVYQQVKSDVHLASISGGTDIISCFMLGCPWLPVYRGEIQCRGLGMAVEAWNEEGHAVIEEKGELVCTKPFVSMPVSFFGADGDKKYFNSYFNYYKDQDIWRHGDFIKITKHGGVIVYGRSDATLNPGGVRIGTAEIYRVVESLEEIDDSIAVGQKDKDDVKIVLFVKLSPGVSWSDELGKKIRTHIRSQLSPRHVPSVVEAVQDIPYTRSGKKMELAVEKAIHGEEIGNLSAMMNPNSIDAFKAYGQRS